MNHIEVANRIAPYLDDVDQLVLGHLTARTANRLGVTIADGEDFIRAGVVSAQMAARLRFATLAAVDELARALGREGRIGLLFGLLLET